MLGKNIDLLKSKSTAGLALLGAGIIAAMAGAAAISPAHAAEFKLTAGSSHPPVLPWVAAIRDHVVPQSNIRLKKAGSQHSIKWTEAYAGTLYNFKNTLEGIEQGLADIGWVGTLWEPGKMPLQNMQFYTPFAASDTLNLAKIMDDLNHNVPEMKAAWTKHKQVYLGSQVTDSYVLISKKPIADLPDLKGVKIMVGGAASLWLGRTGAVAVNGGLPIFFNSIKTGVADGALMPGTGVLPFKLHQVAPYITQIDFGPIYGGALTMNLATWNKLPEEVRKVFAQLGKEYARIVAETVAKNRIKHFAILGKQGAKISKLPDAVQAKWAKTIPNLAGQWAGRMEKAGHPGKAIVTKFMGALRDAGTKPIRNWDKEL